MFKKIILTTIFTSFSFSNDYYLSFDGVDDYISIPSVTFGGDFTFLGYINFNSLDGNSNVFINGDGSNFIRLDNGGSGNEWNLGYNSQTGANHIGISTLPFNEWSYVGIVRENEILSFYLNGQLDGQFEEINSNINFDIIGFRDGSWNGSLDDFSLWTIALSQANIQEYMGNIPSGNIPGLYASWDFNYGEGETIYDLSINQNHGTINGASWNLNGSNLIISGILDLDLPESGNSGKGIVVQALEDISDLSIYGIGIANNGGGTDGVEYTFPSQSLNQGENLWVIRNADAYSNYFGSDVWSSMNYVIDQEGYGIGQNGDDAVELFLNGEVVDLFGYIDVDGTGETWEYKDAWVHRNCDARMPAVVFLESDWTIAEPNCTDTDDVWSHSLCPYPFWDCQPAGCMDPYAGNYDSQAMFNDGSCSDYPGNGSYVLDFSSSSAYTHLDWNQNFNNYTLSIWVKSNLETQPVYASYFSSHYPNSDGFQLDSDGNGNYRLLSVNGTITIAPLSTEWSHVVLVAETTENNEEKTTVYFNGDSIGSINYVDNIWNKIDLGRNRNQDGNGYGNYRVDNVIIWDTPLTSEQIQAHIEYGSVEQPEKVLIHWKLNAGTGNIVYDHSGNSHHTTAYNTAWIEDGAVSGCLDPLSLNYNPDANLGDDVCDYLETGNYVLQFNGDHDYVSVPHHNSLNITDNNGDQGTIMAWVNLNYTNTTEPDYARIISKKYSWNDPSGFEFEINPHEDVITFLAGDDNYAQGSLTHQNSWIHVAVSFSGSAAKIYFNGNDVTFDGDINPVLTTESDLRIGTFVTSAGTEDECCSINGMMDELVVFDSELSQTQIQSYMVSPPSGDENNIAAYWKFNAGQDAILYDHSGNANHGTLNGPDWQLFYNGTKWHVSTSGSDDNIGNFDLPFATIQAGINEANDGDTVFVYEGVYTENISFKNKNIILIGENKETTIIDGNQSGSVIVFEGNETTIARIENFTIRNGIAERGAGINFSYADANIENCNFIDNTATGAGSHINTCGNNEIINCSFSGGNVDPIFQDCGSSSNYINCFINVSGANSAVSGNGYPNLINCTVLNYNSIAYSPFGNGSANIINTIFIPLDGHEEALIAYSDRNDAAINVTIDYSFFLNEGVDVALQGGGQITYGSNNVNGLDSPLFCNDGNENFTLANNSPCVGSGQNGENIGAFNIGCGNVFKNYYVSADAQDGGNGGVDTPFLTIQAAINAVSNSDTILVASGIYSENINFNGKNIVIKGQDKENTIIDGNEEGTVVTFVNAESNSAVLMDFTIQNGVATTGDGGGINCRYSSPTLKNLIIKNNSAISDGGGICCYNGSSPIVKDVKLFENNAGWGGAFFCAEEESNPVLTNVLISNNSGLNGAVCIWNDANPIFNYVTIADNGFFSENIGDESGFHNEFDNTNVIISNSILWGNEMPPSGQIANVVISNSLIEEGAEGEGNIAPNPLFINSTALDYHLSEFSPALGGASITDIVTGDINGNSRPNPVGTNPDMGAYESELSDAESVLYGDVTLNGTVSSFDAANILRHVVQLDTLSSLSAYMGDVSQNNELSSLDASYILQYVVGLVDELPYVQEEETVFSGGLIMDDMGAVPGMTVEVPIRIMESDNNIYSFKATLNYDHTQIALDTIRTGDYLGDFLMKHNIIDDGKALVASYGYSPNSNSDILAIATFTVLEQFDNITSISISDLKINDQKFSGISANANVGYVLGIDGSIPQIFSLHQNYPNPFNPVTKIRYDLPKEEYVSIIIYDVIGRNIKSLINKKQNAGYRFVRWDATNNYGEAVSAGMYIYVIKAGEFRATKKMVLLK